ncbi:putative ribonuclease H-like domain-containing protein [Tanacetum coccineum]|uniref:Ribonuclease H-like domain-containing protein n=1 Tax=Tanacetum coccineum TaxID=301880 RepID=A0ABQ5IP48_9ASTR
MIAPSTSNTNDVNTANPAYEVSTVSPNINTACPQYFQRTGKKIFINANDTAGYDKSKVECFNCHKMRQFARECRAPRNKEGHFRYQDNTRKQGNNEDISLKGQCWYDGVVAFDWSDMVAEQSATYKRGLTTIEEQLVTYRKNEVLFSEEVAVLKREVSCKDYEINVLKSEFEKVKQEKEGIEFKIEKFDDASKSLDKLLGSQITDKSKKGLGYNDVPPPHPLIYNRPKKLDLSYSGLDKFKDSEFKSYGSKDSKLESNIVCYTKSENSKENSDDSLIEFIKPKNHEKQVKKSVRYTEMYRSQSPRGNQRNWNGHNSKQLGSDFMMYNKDCFICGSFDHVQINCNYHQRERMVSRNNYNRVDYDYYAKTTHSSAHRNMTLRAVLLKISLTPLNIVRPDNTAHPKPAVHSAKSMSHFCKQAQSTDHMPFYKKTTLTSKYVNTAMKNYHIERPRAVNTARSCTTLVNAIRAKRANAIKTSACWVWRPTRPNGASLVFKRHNYIEARGRIIVRFIDSGCSRHMTGNIAYLLYFNEFDRGYVTFGGGAHGGRISVDNFRKIPRKDNMYSFDMKNIVPRVFNCLVERAIIRLISCSGIGGLGSNTELLVSPSSLMHKEVLLVVMMIIAGLLWVFFCNKTKDENSEILKNFIKEIENLVDKKVKIIRSDNGTEYKNKVMDDFCREKGIKREYSVARTPQQNGVAKRRNMILFEAARTMLADYKLPTTFWAEAVTLSFMRPFGCHVTILNTLDNVGKFDGKSDEGFFVGYSLSSKAFRVHKENLMQVHLLKKKKSVKIAL